MTYIRCPHCGAKALNVATICPACRTPLSQNPMEAGPHGLTPCRRCAKLIERDSTICPYCGYHGQRGRRRRRWAAAGAVGAVLLVGIVVGIRAAGGPGAVGAWIDWATSWRSDTTPVARPAPAPSPPVAAAIPAAAPARPADTAPEPVAPADSAPLAPGPVPPLVTRYAANWANVRAGRMTDSAVVAVLAPGEAVTVARPRGGWWEVWRGGRRLGFVAADLLRTQPAPDSLP